MPPAFPVFTGAFTRSKPSVRFASSCACTSSNDSPRRFKLAGFNETDRDTQHKSGVSAHLPVVRISPHTERYISMYMPAIAQISELTAPTNPNCARRPSAGTTYRLPRGVILIVSTAKTMETKLAMASIQGAQPHLNTNPAASKMLKIASSVVATKNPTPAIWLPVLSNNRLPHHKSPATSSQAKTNAPTHTETNMIRL